MQAIEFEATAHNYITENFAEITEVYSHYQSDRVGKRLYRVHHEELI